PYSSRKHYLCRCICIVKDIMKDVMSNLQQTNSEKILLSWVRQCTRSYSEVNVLNFTTSWCDGLALNAILHHFRPEAFSWDQVVKMSPVERLDHAFTFAKNQLAIEKLLDPEDVAVQLPDKKSIIMYVTSLFAVLPKDVSMEAIREVETLPRKYKVEAEDSNPGLKAETFVDSSQNSTYMDGSLLEVDLDSYQTTLEEVLTWLLSAEDALHIQDEVSDDVEEVKDQFHTHEGFMMELTAHQSSVGNVLQAGNQLIVQGNLTDEEEEEIREQMTLLNSRWESLRVASMDRQARLHEVLMELQQQQLQQLSDWLTLTEERIKKMETEPAAKDVDIYKENIEKHKELQNDLEAEQVKVNSLTHMVVVVDENCGESATAVLEEQLQSLGERWAAVCRWTEERWHKLQEVFLVWQQLLSDQSLIREWLAEKEDALNQVQTSNFRDPSEMNANVRQLTILKEDMEKKRRTLDKLSDAGQDVMQLLQSAEAGAKIEADTEELTHRWDNLVQKLEDCSFQVYIVDLCLSAEGAGVDSVRENIDLIQTEWDVCARELQAARDRVHTRTRIRQVSSEIADLDQMLEKQDQWLATTSLVKSNNEVELRNLRGECKSRLAQVTALGLRLEQLSSEAGTFGMVPSLKDNMVVVSAHHSSTLQQLQNREQEVNQGKHAWLCTIISKNILILYLCLEIEQKQQATDPAELQKWSQLSSKAREEHGMLQCVMGSMKDNQVRLEQVERWLEAVQELLSRDATGIGDAENLQAELNQCKEYVTEMELMERSLMQMEENVMAVQATAVPGLVQWGQDKLDHCQERWATLSKQLLSHQEHVAENQEKQLNLKKDLTEMQEWMAQVDEEFLMRDFEYKSPEDLEVSLEEMKRAKEDVLQKEVKVKILKDSINLLVSRTSHPAGGSGQELTSELDGVLANYHKLCDRLKSKCHTLEEVWSCWMELLQYLDMEQGWLNTVEEKLQATENVPENTETVTEALESLEGVLRHPGDNRTQIRELGQTLIDGGILDELISEKLEAFNSRYDQLNHQAVNRQVGLEQQLQTLKENEQALQTLQESLNQLDHTLTSYLTDRVDAFQLPLEAQTIGAEIAAHELTVEEMKRRNVTNLPSPTAEGKPARGATMLDQLQSKDISLYKEISTKYQLFQKPANFEQRMLDCKQVLDGAKAELPILDVKDVEPEIIQSHLSGCMKLYKLLSEVKLEVETVIKTGRQIVQKQQTENPKAMDEQLTALKLLYNDLGAQVTEGKQDLEKALSLSQKFDQESSALQEWLSTTEAQLQQKNSCGDMPADIEAEIRWANGLLKESEHRKEELSSLTEISAGLQTLVEGSEAQLEGKLCGLNEAWGQVRTWTEDWLSAVLSHENEVEIFDENLAHISTWLYQTQIHLDEAERIPPAEREKVLKQLDEISLRVDNVRDQAVILMTSRGPACRDVVEPKLAELNCNFDKVSQHIKSTQESQEESQTPLAQTVFPTEIKDLQAELQDKLRTLHEEQDQMDEEKASVEDLLRRGEELLQQTSDEPQKEELRVMLLRLQSQYSAQRVRQINTSCHSRAQTLTPSDYLLEINKVLLAMADNELLLNSSELNGGLYEDFSSQEDTLKTIKDNLEHLGEQIHGIHERQPEAMRDASPDEVVQIGDNLTQLNAEWDRLNRMHNQRKGSFDRAIEEWGRFHCDLKDLSQWLTETEILLSKSVGPDGQLDLGYARQHQELEEGLSSHQPILTGLTRTGEQITGQLSSPDGPLLEEKLETLVQRWRAVKRQVLDRQRRLTGEDPALLELVRRYEHLAVWLDQAENAASSLPVSATDENLKELKALAVEMDAQNERLGWLNKHAPQILASPSVSTQSRDHHVGKLRAINLKWSKVTHDLLDKVGEVETNLQSHTLFQDRMAKLTDWTAVLVLVFIHLQALEVSMKDRKKDLEDLLAHSIELQKHQQLLPQEKGKVEQLAADWKALDGHLRQSLQVPVSPWTHQQHVVQHQQLVSSVPPAVHMASLATEDSHLRAPYSADTVAPTDLNKRATEMADWLLLITQMLKSNIVTVGDTKEIRMTIGRLQVTKSDLEQRHSELEDIFTLAQNIKNKTSNVDVRTSISEKLEKVRSQWDSTQHGIEARLQQLEDMTVHSNQWEEKRKEVKTLFAHNEGLFHNLLQRAKDPLTKQLEDSKVRADFPLGRDQVAAFNELSNHLLREYSSDDTRRIKEVTEKQNVAWNSLSKRANDHRAQLDSELKEVQVSLKELESFLRWLQESETTVTVLSDASHREDVSQDSANVKELRRQLEDIQAEIDAHNDIYKSVDGNKSKMVKALGNSEEAVFLQHRLDDMNQRWSDLKAKSANIRAHLEASAERWSRLLGLLEELWRWICTKDEELAKQMPVGGDVPTLLQQQNHCTVRIYKFVLLSLLLVTPKDL
uniref:Utrophin n=1 Tax=Xiphophorus couchianus TaxID=32473 RepID=A0A3B5L058_9TELE